MAESSHMWTGAASSYDRVRPAPPPVVLDLLTQEIGQPHPTLQQFAKCRGRHEMCEVPQHACLFDRPERTLGASGGCWSAHERSRSPL